MARAIEPTMTTEGQKSNAAEVRVLLRELSGPLLFWSWASVVGSEEVAE